MLTPVPSERWTAVRGSLRQALDQFSTLVLSAPDPDAMATADWSIADVAAHVSTTARLYRYLIPPGDPADVDRWISGTTVDSLAGVNDHLLELYPDRDPRRVIARIRADVEHMLDVSADQDPNLPVTWLGGAKIPLAGALAHMLNELQIHRRDVAGPLRAPWSVTPQDAALVFDLFIIGLAGYGSGVFLDTASPPPQRRIAVEFRSAHTVPVTMVLDHGTISIEEPGGPTDIRITFDPPTFMLMLFHRITKARAVLSGRLRIGGPRPWLLPGFLKVVRAP